MSGRELLAFYCGIVVALFVMGTILAFQVVKIEALTTEDLRNLALFGAAVLGLPLLIWHSVSADKLSNAALQQAKAATDNVA